jgi:hypothetical protein
LLEKQNRAQGGVTPLAPLTHLLTAVLGDLLEATRSLAESVSVFGMLLSFSQHLSSYPLPADYLVLHANALL